MPRDERAYEAIDQVLRKMNSEGIPEIPRDHVTVQDLLGAGNFGDVHRGVLLQDDDATKLQTVTASGVAMHVPQGPRTVALKTLKETAKLVERAAFIDEAILMARLKHPNVVSLLGAVVRGGELTIVLEFMENGSLLDYLKDKEETLKRSALIAMARDIAAGMVVLESAKLVHRDLAARNVLVNSNGSCKIGDFGLARTLENDYYITNGGHIAVRWTAPEAIHFRKFSSKSDVWSFGVVCWEIFSFGQRPFEELNGTEITKLIDDGGRLPMPEMASDRVYAMMLNCWNADPHERPTFLQLFAEYQGIVVSMRTKARSTVASAGDTEPYVQLVPEEAYTSYLQVIP
eukprot:Opistho-2@88378